MTGPGRPRTAPWPWRAALVTGASSGIGREMAGSLAAGGVPRIVVVARRRARLDELARQLSAEHGTDVEVLVADLAAPHEVRRVEDRLAAAQDPIDLLVNNAGIGSSGPFVEADPEADDELLAVNVVALTRLTHAAGRAMVDRGRGAICQVSSLTSYQPTPGAATYAASKAFVVHLGEALYEELRGTGVTVTTLVPGFTHTEMTARSSERGGESSTAPRFAFLPADVVARAALEATAAGRPLCIPGVRYRLVAAAVTPLPRSSRRWLMGRLTGAATSLARRLDR